jgi:hypothetical protein
MCEELERENERLAARLRALEPQEPVIASEVPSLSPTQTEASPVARDAVASALRVLEQNEAKPKAARASVPAPKRPPAAHVAPSVIAPRTRPPTVNIRSAVPLPTYVPRQAPLPSLRIAPMWILWFLAAFVGGVIAGVRYW